MKQQIIEALNALTEVFDQLQGRSVVQVIFVKRGRSEGRSLKVLKSIMTSRHEPKSFEDVAKDPILQQKTDIGGIVKMPRLSQLYKRRVIPYGEKSTKLRFRNAKGQHSTETVTPLAIPVLGRFS